MTIDNPLVEPTADRVAPPAVLVVFGASGDLTSRKLMPAIEHLSLRRLLPAAFAVVGVARTEMDDDDFRERMRTTVEKIGGGGDEARHVWDAFAGAFRYVAGDYGDQDTYDRLRAVLDELDRERGTGGNRLYYLATPPTTFPVIAEHLGIAGLNKPERDEAFVRIVIEKPFGHDQQSAADLDTVVHRSFDESQVYRIDHYLGKETVQNVLALRFANAIFEPIWNRRYVDHVQVTVAEALGVGHRGSFYEQAGALRDIVQNHVMQVLALTMMEPPATFDPNAVRDEKVKALRAVNPFTPADVMTNVVRGQYRRGWAQGEEVAGYRDEEGVHPHSLRETYVAMKVEVDNWRWAGVPFYVRTGKRLPKRVTEVAMTFKDVPHLPFASEQAEGLEPDALVLRIQPDEGITLRFGAKVPGQAFEVRTVAMDFSYGAAFLEESAEAYERLLLDALVGDPTLFI
ncbi:MAG TPA: glucose-6-phosphate dehydrogenase, partial [Acidimicrobiales bacterium]